MEQTRQSTDTPADADFLTGHLLIAMPAMADPRFAHSVIYVCAHTLEGAMGLVLNRPLERPKFDDLLRQLEVAPVPPARRIRLCAGGPTGWGSRRTEVTETPPREGPTAPGRGEERVSLFDPAAEAGVQRVGEVRRGRFARSGHATAEDCAHVLPWPVERLGGVLVELDVASVQLGSSEEALRA